MAKALEVQLSDDSLLVFDGTILEVFAGGVQMRVHVRGLEGMEIKEGRTSMGRQLEIKNRFGSDAGLSYDQECLPELREFTDQVLAAAQG